MRSPILFAVGAYALLVAGMTAIQRDLMYFPGGSLPDPREIGARHFETVRLKTEDGLDLVAWYAPAKTRDVHWTIVYFHGNAGGIDGRLPRVLPFVEAGHGVLLVEYRGYGGNPGKPTEEGLYADGRAALAYLRGLGIAPRRMALLGESLGTGIATKIASEVPEPVGAVVLQAPFTSAADIAQSVYPFLPARWMLFDKFANIDRIEHIRAPLLIVHGSQDEVVPVEHGHALLDRAQEPKAAHFIRGAMHNNLSVYRIDGLILDFLNSIK